MRKWIDIIVAEPNLLVEGNLEEAGFSRRFGELTAAAALAGTAGYNIDKSPKSVDDLPQMIMVHDDGKFFDDDDVDPVGKRQADAKVSSPRGPVVSMTQNEAVKLLALTMWGEARSDGPEAMRAVGHVIMNRLGSERRFGRNIKEVVWKRKAFSCWNVGDPNREAMREITKLDEDNLNKVRWYQAVALARKIIAGESRDPTGGSLFYHTKGMGRPYWVSPNNKPTAEIASHYFYRSDSMS